MARQFVVVFLYFGFLLYGLNKTLIHKYFMLPLLSHDEMSWG